MTEEQKTKNHYEMLNNSSNKALVDLIKMQDNKIEQLKKQNKELQNGNFVLTVNEIIEGKDKKIAELEKENAELKERLKEHENIGNAQFWKNVWSWKTKAEQLTKAKNLLAKWVELFKPKVGNIPPTPIQVDTEQFLNSEVEK